MIFMEFIASRKATPVSRLCLKQRASAGAVNVCGAGEPGSARPGQPGEQWPLQERYRCMFRLRSHTVSSAERVSFAR
jgi:hypothetical protein